MQFQVRTNEVFCEQCASDLACSMESRGIGEVFVEPIETSREWVKCGACNERVYSEKRTA